MNRNGYRFVPNHELAKAIIRPCRALARDIFSFADRLSSAESDQLIYGNTRRADLAGFSFLVGERLDRFLKKDLFVREEAIAALSSRPQSATMIGLPKVGRVVALLSADSCRAISARVPDSVYVLGFERAYPYDRRVADFIETAIRPFGKA